MWFLVRTLTQIWNEREQTGQEKYKTYSLRRKGALESALELSPVSKEIKGLKESLLPNRKKGGVTLRQDSTH